MLVTTCRATWHHNQNDHNQHPHHQDNVRSLYPGARRPCNGCKRRLHLQIK
jgi:hypothetical protein